LTYRIHIEAVSKKKKKKEEEEAILQRSVSLTRRGREREKEVVSIYFKVLLV
jgi:hypothetical protein